ncbi:uncharacterized protein LOC142411922 [Mycteria americana]|uniref:uncharacterized protein LOC142411922 n=1 Tax=Mycteria americana TaxID=33587 RepID=UPI003F58FE48
MAISNIISNGCPGTVLPSAGFRLSSAKRIAPTHPPSRGGGYPGGELRAGRCRRDPSGPRGTEGGNQHTGRWPRTSEKPSPGLLLLTLPLGRQREESAPAPGRQAKSHPAPGRGQLRGGSARGPVWGRGGEGKGRDRGFAPPGTAQGARTGWAEITPEDALKPTRVTKSAKWLFYAGKLNRQKSFSLGKRLRGGSAHLCCGRSGCSLTGDTWICLFPTARKHFPLTRPPQ